MHVLFDSGINSRLVISGSQNRYKPFLIDVNLVGGGERLALRNEAGFTAHLYELIKFHDENSFVRNIKHFGLITTIPLPSPLHPHCAIMAL